LAPGSLRERRREEEIGEGGKKRGRDIKTERGTKSRSTKIEESIF